MKIAGVDFSGAKTDDRTWVSTGTLEDNVLTLDDCRPVGRDDLSQMLLAMSEGSVAALDFPFAVPEHFAKFWNPSGDSMPDLWDQAASIDLAQFLDLRDRYLAEWGEPKRRCDLRFPECYSCLHKANPNMVPMTFYGMRMLGPLWRAGCSVPPIEDRTTIEDRAPASIDDTGQDTGEGTGPNNSNREHKAVLLEAMPGAALKAMKLPHKGYKNGANALKLRDGILSGLESSSGIKIKNLSHYRKLCQGSHDALDSVVAAVIASLWANDPDVFWRPDLDGPDRVALLEGWLYAPVHI